MACRFLYCLNLFFGTRVGIEVSYNKLILKSLLMLIFMRITNRVTNFVFALLFTQNSVSTSFSLPGNFTLRRNAR